MIAAGYTDEEIIGLHPEIANFFAGVISEDV